MLTAKRFWLISLLILTLIILVRMQPIVEWADGNRKRTKSVSISVILDEHPKEITRKLQFTTKGNYDVNYRWRYKENKSLKKYGHDVPESITGLIEIYDIKGNLLLRHALTHPSGGSGMRVMVIKSSSLQKNQPFIFKISGLKLGVDDVMPPSEITFTIFKPNYMFGY